MQWGLGRWQCSSSHTTGALGLVLRWRIYPKHGFGWICPVPSSSLPMPALPIDASAFTYLARHARAAVVAHGRRFVMRHAPAHHLQSPVAGLRRSASDSMDMLVEDAYVPSLSHLRNDMACFHRIVWLIGICIQLLRKKDSVRLYEPYCACYAEGFRLQSRGSEDCEQPTMTARRKTRSVQ